MRWGHKIRCEAPAHRAGLPGNVDIITGSTLTPLRESVTALPAGHLADLPANDLAENYLGRKI
jgi:hypothetical protein